MTRYKKLHENKTSTEVYVKIIFGLELYCPSKSIVLKLI